MLSFRQALILGILKVYFISRASRFVLISRIACTVASALFYLLFCSSFPR